MELQNKKSFIKTGCFFLVFVVYTLLISTIDVKPIGPEHSKVGFAAINGFVHDTIGVHMGWYEITEVLGKVAFLFVVGFALLGAYQLIKRKSLFKVDKEILVLAGFYVLMMVLYFIFEFITVNYRPVILDEGLEASYPSTHTFLAICIMGTSMIEFHRLIPRGKPLLITLNVLALVIMFLTVVGRLLSGVHWFTDILGGVLLAIPMLMGYRAATQYFESRN